MARVPPDPRSKLGVLSAAEPGPASAARPQPTVTNQIPADRRYWVLATVMLVQFTAVVTGTTKRKSQVG